MAYWQSMDTTPAASNIVVALGLGGAHERCTASSAAGQSGIPTRAQEVHRVRDRAQAEHPGKTDKLPVNPITHAYPVSGKDPANWLSCDDAYAKANELNARRPADLRVGFWLTAELCIWCLDIDQGLDANDQWKPAVNELCAQLSGVAWEYSHSKVACTGGAAAPSRFSNTTRATTMPSAACTLSFIAATTSCCWHDGRR